MKIRVGAVEDLVVSKRLVGRTKDLEHLPELERLLAERELSLPEAEITPPARDTGAEPDIGP